MSLHEVVIVGAGQAGVQAAFSLRQKGYDGAIRLVGDEPGLPYQRPPLSKTVPKGEEGADQILLRTGAAFEKSRIDLLAGEAVAAVDRAARVVSLAGGGRLPYDHLVLATGARNRRLPVPGGEHPDVIDVRTLPDAVALRDRLKRPGRVVVVGGGFVGLEIAACARSLGHEVVVCEALERLMARTCSALLAAYVLEVHRASGIDVRLGARACRVTVEGGAVAGVELEGGERLACDVVVVGIGVAPRTELARDAGLAADDGIVVDATLRTADPNVSAIGDCAAFDDPRTGRRLRLESVQNAIDQGKAVARNLLETPTPHDVVPWFWSDQGAMKIQIAGLTAGYAETVAKRHPETGSVAVFCFENRRLVGLETVDAPGDHVLGRTALERGPCPSLADVACDDFVLKAWMKAHRH